MKQRKILNICMVISIVFTIGCGLMAVGSIKGWFGNTETSSWVISEKTGIAMVERKDVAYEVEKNTMVEAEDRLYTKTAATLTISYEGQPQLYMGTNADVTAVKLDASPKFEVTKGEVLADTRKGIAINFIFGKTKMMTQNALAGMSVQPGATTVHVYSGEIILENMENPEEKPMTVSAGKKVLILDRETTYDISNLSVENLSEIQIETLKTCELDEERPAGRG